MTNIPKEMMSEWMLHPVTKKIFEQLRKIRSDHQTVLCDGGTLNTDSSDKTSLQTALLLGKISGMNILLEIDLSEED